MTEYQHARDERGAPDFTEEIYAYLRSLGDPGDTVLTRIHPWLMETYGLSAREAWLARYRAMEELKAAGRVERLKVRSRWLRILA
jgi:hypothetical protein